MSTEKFRIKLTPDISMVGLEGEWGQWDGRIDGVEFYGRKIFYSSIPVPKGRTPLECIKSALYSQTLKDIEILKRALKSLEEVKAALEKEDLDTTPDYLRVQK